LEAYAGPGHWNDPDILEVGNGGMTKEEDRAHFSMWALFSAPLLAGNDLSRMSADTKEILLNKEVIAIDQDALGQPGRRFGKNGDLEVWSKPLADGGRAVVLLNRSAAAAKINVRWTDIGYPASLAATVRDLWTTREVSKQKESYSAEVQSHGVVMVTVKA
jgi:alpha-galactosidase